MILLSWKKINLGWISIEIMLHKNNHFSIAVKCFKCRLCQLVKINICKRKTSTGKKRGVKPSKVQGPRTKYYAVFVISDEITAQQLWENENSCCCLMCDVSSIAEILQRRQCALEVSTGEHAKSMKSVMS